MKIILFTEWTPTPENRGGISALSYGLLRYRPHDIEVKILTYNYNRISEKELQEISKQLNANIELIRVTPKTINLKKYSFYRKIEKFFCWSAPKYNFYDKQIIERLEKETCDFFLLYPRAMYNLATLLPHRKFVISGPDCETLNRSRRFSNPYRLSTIKMMIDDFLYLVKYKDMEKYWGADNVRVHFVGMEDYRFYRDINNNNNAHFLLHPFVKYKEKNIDFSHKKLKVIIPGGYDMYYNTDVDKMLPALIANKEKLQKTFEFTFLGKHWYPIDERLKAAGFKAEFKTWVEDYAEELVQHDIEITPISFGTGTKGKVLDAMVNGLLVVGSGYALENICVRDMESCVRYREASQIASILISIANHRDKYQTIAEKGRQQVMKYHNPERISKRFFEIYGKEFGVI